MGFNSYVQHILNIKENMIQNQRLVIIIPNNLQSFQTLIRLLSHFPENIFGSTCAPFLQTECLLLQFALNVCYINQQIMQDPSLEGVSIRNLCKQLYSANIYLFKKNNRKTGERSETCSKLTIKAPERCPCFQLKNVIIF